MKAVREAIFGALLGLGLCGQVGTVLAERGERFKGSAGALFFRGAEGSAEGSTAHGGCRVAA